MLRIMVAGIVVGLLTLLSSCYEEQPDQKFVVDDLCNLVNFSGEKVEAVDVHDNQLIEWANHSTRTVKIVVTDPNVLSGRNSVRLDPGDRIVIRVAYGQVKSMLSWYCGRGDGEDDDDETGDDDGEGGGNTPVNNDPPPPGP